ncbi:hypothetical protein N8Z31_00095 [Pelagibacteraceae bacterium]|nr:hypothetical protein [Pelagibacteraceae bacterium]
MDLYSKIFEVLFPIFFVIGVGLYLGKKIKIINYSKKILTNIDFLFLGIWNFKKEILFKEKNFTKRGGKFITHVPFPKVF